MSTQLKTLTLKCPSCGAALDVAPDMERFACGYCGSEQIVQRQGGTVALKLVTDAIARVQFGTDRTAAELALRRINDEMAALDAEAHEIHLVRGANIGPGMLAFMGVFALAAFLVAQSVEWEGAPVCIIIAVVLFVIAAIVHAQPDPHKDRLEELKKQYEALAEKRAQQKAIVDT